MTHPDAFVIGGGIVGLTTAYSLAKAGARATVADRGELGKESSWAGAGIIPPLTRNVPDSPFDRLRSYSVGLFESFSAELKTRTGIDNEYHVGGGIELLPIDDREALAMWDRDGVNYRTVESVAWLRAPKRHHSYSLDYGQVRNPRHLAALIEACRQVGVTLLPHQPINPNRLPHAGAHLIATGAWADEFLKPHGLPPLVHPVRGQIVLFKPSRPVVPKIVIVGHRYLVPRKDGRVLVGSTEEPEAGYVKENTTDGVEGLIHFARELVPGLADAEIETTWAGLRPGSKDGLPYMGPVPGTKNLFAAVGHYRSGVQLSPGTGEVMKALILGETPPVPAEAFRLDRPPAPFVHPAFRS